MGAPLPAEERLPTKGEATVMAGAATSLRETL